MSESTQTKSTACRRRGRPRKSIAELKASGQYREGRHSEAARATPTIRGWPREWITDDWRVGEAFAVIRTLTDTKSMGCGIRKAGAAREHPELAEYLAIDQSFVDEFLRLIDEGYSAPTRDRMTCLLSPILDLADDDIEDPA